MRLSDLESRYLTEKIKRKDQEDFQNGSQTEINYDRLNVRKKLFSATPLKRISKEEYLHQYDKYLNDKQLFIFRIKDNKRIIILESKKKTPLGL